MHKKIHSRVNPSNPITLDIFINKYAYFVTQDMSVKIRIYNACCYFSACFRFGELIQNSVEIITHGIKLVDALVVN